MLPSGIARAQLTLCMGKKKTAIDAVHAQREMEKDLFKVAEVKVPGHTGLGLS